VQIGLIKCVLAICSRNQQGTQYSIYAQGEIDILEGVNDQGPNQSTLHTNSGQSDVLIDLG